MTSPVVADVCRPVADRAKPGPMNSAVHAIWDLVGLSCVADAVRLERHLRALPGVHAAVVNPVTERVYLTFDRRALSEPEVAAAIARLGFHAERADAR